MFLLCTRSAQVDGCVFLRPLALFAQIAGHFATQRPVRLFISFRWNNANREMTNREIVCNSSAPLVVKRCKFAAARPLLLVAYTMARQCNKWKFSSTVKPFYLLTSLFPASFLFPFLAPKLFAPTPLQRAYVYAHIRRVLVYLYIPFEITFFLFHLRFFLFFSSWMSCEPSKGAQKKKLVPIILYIIVTFYF